MKQIPTGTRAVIIGNGPSVDMLPPAAWGEFKDRGWLLVGTNRVLVFEALRGVFFDALCIHDTPGDLWANPKIASDYHDCFWKTDPAWRVGPAAQRVAYCDEYCRIENHWVDRLSRDRNQERAVRGGSVTVMALNWAWQQGCRELAMIGVDYCGGGYARMFPGFNVPTSGPHTYNEPAVEPCIEQQFTDAMEGVAAGGGRLVNLSQGSVLKAVPIVSLQELLAS